MFLKTLFLLATTLCACRCVTIPRDFSGNDNSAPDTEEAKEVKVGAPHFVKTPDGGEESLQDLEQTRTRRADEGNDADEFSKINQRIFNAISAKLGSLKYLSPDLRKMNFASISSKVQFALKFLQDLQEKRMARQNRVKRQSSPGSEQNDLDGAQGGIFDLLVDYVSDALSPAVSSFSPMIGDLMKSTKVSRPSDQHSEDSSRFRRWAEVHGYSRRQVEDSIASENEDSDLDVKSLGDMVDNLANVVSPMLDYIAPSLGGLLKPAMTGHARYAASEAFKMASRMYDEWKTKQDSSDQS